MLSKKIEKALNQQIAIEGDSSQAYLAMASWAEIQGLNGIAQFLYKHSEEERAHMLKLVHYINERGGHAVIPAFKAPPTVFHSVPSLFEDLLNAEITVSNDINKVVHICLEEKDYTTHNFLQWYVAEQIEEEGLARNIMDRLKLLGDDKGGLYMFDRDIASYTFTSAAKQNPA